MLKRNFLNDRLARHTTMTPDEWAKIPECPRQRDTELHAKKAIKWLIDPVPPHLEAKMGKLSDGREFKLDGHTRSYLWVRRMIPVPEVLDVTIYELENIDEVMAAYDWFDNSNAAERGPEIVQGAFRANGLHPVSPQLRSGKLNTALRRLYRMIAGDDEDYDPSWKYDNIYEAVRLFSKELMQLDALEPTSRLFPPGIHMAVLITLKRDPDEAAKFWKLYAEERGKKEAGRMDAVQALMEGVLVSKSRNNTNVDIVGETFGKALAAFQAFRIGTDYASGSGSGVRAVGLSSIRKYVKKRAS